MYESASKRRAEGSGEKPVTIQRKCRGDIVNYWTEISVPRGDS